MDRGSKTAKGGSTLLSILAVAIGAALVLTVVTLFVTGVAQKEIWPEIFTDQGKNVSSVQIDDLVAELDGASDTIAYVWTDSLEARRTQLETESRRLDARQQELVRLRGEIESLLVRYAEIQDERLAREARLYGNMRPEEAAPVLEAMDDFLFMADRDVAKVTAKDFKQQGLDIKLGAKVSAAKPGKNGVEVAYDDKSGSQTIEVDKLIVAVGRRPHTDKLF